MTLSAIYCTHLAARATPRPAGRQEVGGERKFDEGFAGGADIVEMASCKRRTRREQPAVQSSEK